MADRRAVVIGAGITGVLVARELLLRGWEVTVLEARHVGAGSSSRTAAGIRQQFSTPSTVRGMRHAVAAYERLGEEFGQRCIEPIGYLFLHDDPVAWAAARDRVAMQRAAGLHTVVALERDDLLARFPWASPDLLGGTFDPTDGVLRPEVILHEGARRVRELGGDLRQRAPVVGARHDGDRLAAVVTPDGAVAGDLFLDCTNIWTARLASILRATPLPAVPVKRHLWFLRRADEAMTAETLLRMPLVITPSGVYSRPENADTLLLGYATALPPEPGFADDDQDRPAPGHAHDEGIDAVPFEAWARYAEAVPAASGFAGLVATTAGYYCVTPDHNPFLSYDPAVTNLVRLVGFSGHGAMLAPFTAAVAGALADAGRNLPSIGLPTGEVSLGEFAIDRTFDRAEAMVI